MTQADSIRAFVDGTYLAPIRQSRLGGTILVRAGDVHKAMGLHNRMPAVCSALDAKKFSELYRVSVEDRSGPQQGANASWRFRALP